MKKTVILLSCEHYSNAIPKTYKDLFVGKSTIFQTHRAWDLGMGAMLPEWEAMLNISGYKGKYSRLLVDLNRSPGHKNLFSEFSKPLDTNTRNLILADYYFPYRQNIESLVQAGVENNNRVLHIALHSFTPELNGKVRNTEIGLLYDPTHCQERNFCNLWKLNIQTLLPELRVRSNYPYHGRSDSLPTYLRRKYRENYLGIELETNQSLFNEYGTEFLTQYRKSRVNRRLVESFQYSLENFG